MAVVRAVFGLSTHYGPTQRYGMEVELEGGFLPTVEGWERVTDGSLRGGSEYISPGPKTLRESFTMLNSLGPIIEGSTPSLRTSFHVHVDVSWWETDEVANVIRCYGTLEPAFFQLSGGRSGSQFCCPVYDSALLHHFRTVLGSGVNPLYFPNFDTLKYGALNIGHIRDFGSLEFRHHTGLRTAEEGKEWLRVLTHFCDRAKRMNRDELFQFIRTNPEGLITELFPEQSIPRLEIDPVDTLLHFKALEL